MCVGLLPKTAHGQAFDAVGTRAAGMGGAFVGVADDATAIYWNPGGLAAGAYMSLVLDGGNQKAVPETGLRGQKQSTYFIGLTTPVLGLAYYRLRSAVAVPDQLLVPIDGTAPSRNVTGESHVRLDTLVTHHAGITLVQSIVPSVAVGTTLKLVRGFAGTDLAAMEPGTTGLRESALDRNLESHAATKFDADIGVMAHGGRAKAGLTVRNVREPEFTTPDGRVVRLERQARAGVSFALTPNWVAAADADLTTQEDAFGRRRDAALGIEGRILRRASVRAGLRLSTAGVVDGVDGAERRAVTFGGSYAVKGSVFVDAVVITGGDWAGRGWGVAARFVY